MMDAQRTPDELTYRFHWLDGKVQDGKGKSASDALTRLGYGNGALKALDYWESLDDEEIERE
jgi:hypothetical protein